MADARLVTVANHILEVLAADLEAAGIDVPTRRYVTAGEVSHDFAGQRCAEQFAVSWALSFHGVPGNDFSQQAIKCAVPLSAGFTVNLLRCVPNLSGGKPPTPEDLTASGNQIMLDAMTLPVVIVEAHLQQELVEIGCSLVSMGSVSAYGPQGDVGGTIVELIVGLI